MTDEERQKLCARLRAHEVVMWTDIDLAADEIERLMEEVKNWEVWAKSQPSYQDQEAALAQSDAEPVAWRWRLKGDPDWCFWEDAGPWPDDVEVEPLYTVPPRPDTSAADYDRAWGAIATSDELANVRRKLSIHELRLLIRVVLTGSARAAGRIWK
jgi:hypothetical protein